MVHVAVADNDNVNGSRGGSAACMFGAARRADHAAMTAARFACPECGSEYLERYAHCPRDGSRLGMRDALCGRELAGRYRVLCKVGNGAMSAVYAADDLRLDKRVAIKLLHAEVAGGPQAVERFKREARALCRRTSFQLPRRKCVDGWHRWSPTCSMHSRTCGKYCASSISTSCASNVKSTSAGCVLSSNAFTRPSATADEASVGLGGRRSPPSQSTRVVSPP